MTSICLDLLLIRIYPSFLSQPFVRVGEGFDIVRELFHMAEVSQMYPGRASMSPLLDVFITLVGLGASGWKKLREDRKTVMTWSPFFYPSLCAPLQETFPVLPRSRSELLWRAAAGRALLLAKRVHLGCMQIFR